MIVFCQMTNNERFAETKEGLSRALRANTFDRFILVINEWEGNTLSNTNEQWLMDTQIEYYKRQWNDNFPDARNEYVSKVQNGDWLIVSDSDEHFCMEFLKDIKQIIKDSEDKGLILRLINSHDINIHDNGTKDERVSTYFKNLIYKKFPETKYVGVGKFPVLHEQLVLPQNAPPPVNVETKYYYTHTKHDYEILERAARNVFISGGGNNVGSDNPEWIQLRQICDRLNIKLSPFFIKYLQQGNIDNALRDWLVRNRQMGFDWQNEMVDVFKYYFEYLHPNENINHYEIIPISDSLAQAFAEVEKLYLEVLGRHADGDGKTYYGRLMQQGKLTSDQLRSALFNSNEHKARYPDLHKESEVVTNNVAAEVNVHVTEDLIYDLVTRRSAMFKNTILRHARFGHKWDALLSITEKIESGGHGNDETPPKDFEWYINKFMSLCPVSEYKYVLNPGAGAGSETSILQERGYTITGLTYGEDNLRLGREKYHVTLKQMDMHDLQFPNGYFDAIFTIQTFEHAFAPWLHILEARRVLRNGGRYFVDVPDPDDQAMLETIWHTNVLYVNQITALFVKAGFKLIDDWTVEHRIGLMFEKLPDGTFPMWGYVKFIMNKLAKA